MKVFYVSWRIVLLHLLIFLNACALPIKQTEESLQPAIDWDDRNSRLDNISRWNVDGRIAMKSREDAWSASLVWDQASNDYDIRLFGPLGGKALSIKGGPTNVELKTGDGETFTEQNAAALIYRQTGWHIPVENLQYWARAMPAPGPHGEIEYDAAGYLVRLKQSGWDISYQKYKTVDDLPMPGKMKLVNEHFSVKLVFRDWLFKSSGS